MVTRLQIYSPWAVEQDDRLKLLSSQGATALQAAAVLSRPLMSSGSQLGHTAKGARAVRRKLASSSKNEGPHV